MPGQKCIVIPPHSSAKISEPTHRKTPIPPQQNNTPSLPYSNSTPQHLPNSSLNPHIPNKKYHPTKRKVTFLQTINFSALKPSSTTSYLKSHNLYILKTYICHYTLQGIISTNPLNTIPVQVRLSTRIQIMKQHSKNTEPINYQLTKLFPKITHNKAILVRRIMPPLNRSQVKHQLFVTNIALQQITGKLTTMLKNEKSVIK